ncbi:carboxypeptidase B-like [Lytechinus variegatus]|uniref:carboxypeptidase B-like n=1 Tax=Lytechinus variegatus TaxID=7654 RepID=UPI001BB23659|nr:carboxypeptidase B-like [Lytechinus variegatus]
MGIFQLLRLVFVVFITCQFGAHGKAKVRYDGYQVIRMIPNSLDELEWLINYIESRNEIDVWKEPSKVGHPVDIMIPPRTTDSEDLVSLATDTGISTTVMIQDVQKLIDNEISSRSLPQRSMSTGFDYTTYHTYDEIEKWIDDIANQYSDLVSVDEVSSTYEGKIIRGIKIGSPSGNLKPMAYIQGGIHAREWISPATVMFMTYKLLDAYQKMDPLVTEMFNKIDWYIVPVLNADGYIYTWINDRNWRKNRRRAPGDACVGIDLNRNYAYEWGGKGASRSSCALTYRGPGPASEIEVIGITDFLKKRNEMTDINLYIDVHSYGMFWLYPWGYTDDTTVSQPDRERQYSLGMRANEAINATHGKSYLVGEAGASLYPASGGSDDWAYGELKIKYTYTIELRDEGQYGFMLPETEIEPTTEEIYAAMLVVGEQLLSEL